MSAELSYTDRNGVAVADVFVTGLPAWHEEGTVFPTAPSWDVAMETAQLLYPVAKVPTFRQVERTTEDGGDTFPGYQQNETAYVTIRTDRNVELGMVGKDYTVVQNADAFSALKPLVEEGILLLETGGVLRDGADAWLMGRFDMTRFGPVVREVFGDEVLPYTLIAANHSGRRGNIVALTPIRVVCANTLGFMERDESATLRTTIRHTGEAVKRTAEAAEQLLGGIVARYETVAKAFRVLKAIRLGDDDFKALVIDPALGAHPTKRHGWNPEARMAASVIQRHEAKVAEVTRLRNEGKGHTGDGSAWEAYNGLVEAIDHNKELFPTRSGVYRTQALMEGQLRTVKQKALDAIVDAARKGRFGTAARELAAAV